MIRPGEYWCSWEILSNSSFLPFDGDLLVLGPMGPTSSPISPPPNHESNLSLQTVPVAP